MIWNAIFYLVKTGCQWRMLPLDFPKWQLVYYYYRKWAALLDFDLLLEKLRGHVRVKRGQNMEPSVGIMDSQSVKWGNNTSGWNNNRLLITSGAYVDINLAPLSPDPTATGKTLEFEFATANVSDDNAVVCDLRNSSGTGLLITASEVILKSVGGAEVSTKFKSEENIRVAFVINRKTGVANKGLAFV